MRLTGVKPSCPGCTRIQNRTLDRTRSVGGRRGDEMLKEETTEFNKVTLVWCFMFEPMTWENQVSSGSNNTLNIFFQI